MTRTSGWLAGAASVKFTPSEPLWLAGYAARTAPSRGVHSDLYATALAVRDSQGRTFVFAAADIIAIPKAVADHAARLVRERHPGLPRDHFCFNASHTHYGPEIRTDKVLFFKIPPEYAAKIEATAEKVARAIADAILAALADLRPARLFARHATATFANNRRTTGPGVIDHDVPLLEVRSADDGSLRSLLFGYACHNTCMDPQDRLYSSDWAGRARVLLSERHPTCTPLFITGCGADQNPDPRGTKDLSDEYGRQLADAVDAALTSTDATEISPTLATATASAHLDMIPVTPELLEDFLSSNDPPKVVKAQYLKDRLARGEALEHSYPAPMQALRLGRELLMILMSGETVIDWSHKFKEGFCSIPRFERVWTAGYCNDMYGYVPTLRVQREGGYEGGRANLWSWVPSPWTESVEQTVTETVRQLVSRVTTGHTPQAASES